MELPAWWRRKLAAPQLRTLAGTAAYARGAAYAAETRVAQLVCAGQKLTARVRGGQNYEVRLWRRGDELQFACTSAYAAEGAFCKHCVAVGLACAGGDVAKPSPTAADGQVLAG